MDDDHWLPARPTLRPGLRVVRRDDAHLQVGLLPAERVVLPDVPAVRGLLADLRVGRRPSVDEPEARRWCQTLAARGLLVDASDVARCLAGATDRRAVLAVIAQAGPEAPARLDARRQARIAVAADAPWRAVALRLAGAAGLAVAGPREAPVARLLVSTHGEPARAELDPLVRAGSPHLVVTNVGARVTVGPFVAPGLTACLRCVDAHHCDADPGHALILEQHPPDPAEPCDPVLMHLALAWAVRDLVTYVEGQAPATWSASVTVDAGLAVERREWTRHPRCGCSWGDALAAG